MLVSFWQSESIIYIYISPFFVFPSRLGHHRALSRILCAIQQVLLNYLFYTCAQSESHPALCNPMDCSLPGSSVHGIFQAKILQWVATSYFWGSSQPRDHPCLLRLLHWQVDSLPLAPPAKVILYLVVCIKPTIFKYWPHIWGRCEAGFYMRGGHRALGSFLCHPDQLSSSLKHLP